jgi:hypothetical protein
LQKHRTALHPHHHRRRAGPHPSQAGDQADRNKLQGAAQQPLRPWRVWGVGRWGGMRICRRLRRRLPRTSDR